jgi:hypothetical protein
MIDPSRSALGVTHVSRPLRPLHKNDFGKSLLTDVKGP